MREYKKAYYTIFARCAFPEENIYNYLEDCWYDGIGETAIILHGTVNEEWVVSFEELMRTYTYVDGAPILPEDLGRRIPRTDDDWVEICPICSDVVPTVFAYQIPLDEQEEVKTSEGDILSANRPGVPHGNGDWIVFANDGHGGPDGSRSWMVNGEVFERTYVPV